MKHPTSQETKVGLKIFFNLMEAWAQPIESQMKLLGLDDADEFAKLKEQPSLNISQENLMRISFLMKIHQYLHTIFKNKEQADAWVNKPNTRYEGSSASEDICLNGTQGMEDVCMHLFSQCR
jgi:uncharacterized protein (DUF2384 family)